MSKKISNTETRYFHVGEFVMVNSLFVLFLLLKNYVIGLFQYIPTKLIYLSICYRFYTRTMLPLRKLVYCIDTLKLKKKLNNKLKDQLLPSIFVRLISIIKLYFIKIRSMTNILTQI